MTSFGGAVCGLGMLAAVGLASTARAQEPAPAAQPSGELPPSPAVGPAGTSRATSTPATSTEVVVTALRSNQNIQKTPAAVTALSGALLQAQNITDIRQAQVLVPAAHFGQDETATEVYIRGVGSNLDYYWIPEAVAMNVDGVYTPRYAAAGAFLDVSSLQVLPGPQGVLYGRSAGGGAIVLTSNQPSDRFESIGEAEYGSYNYLHLTGIENVPIADGLSLRGGLEYIRHDGYQSLGADALDSLDAKLTLRYKPSSRLTVLLRGNYYENSGKPAVTTYVPYIAGHDPWYVPSTDPVTGNTNRDGFLHYNYYTVSGDLIYNFDTFSLEYIVGRLQQNESSLRDVVGNDVLFQTGYVQYTQSLRATSTGQGRLKWVAGAETFNVSARSDNRYGQNQYGDLIPEIHQSSYSGFGQATYSLLPYVRAVGGVRYSYDNLKLAGDGIACFQVCYLSPFTFDKDYYHLDFKAGLEGDVWRGGLIYANYQTGYAPGTLNTYPDASSFNKTIEPQTLRAYTAGLKTRFDEGRVTADVEGFRYLYHDLIIQAFNDSLGEQTLYNSPQATVDGVQFTGGVRLTPNDNVGLNLAYTHSAYGHFVSGPGVPDIYGLQLQYTPDVTGSISYEHHFALPRGDEITFRGSTYISSHYWGTFDHSIDTDQSSYTKTDLSLTFKPASGRWYVGVWAKNVENTAVNSVVAGSGYSTPYAAGGYLEAPRTIGFKIGGKL